MPAVPIRRNTSRGARPHALSHRKVGGRKVPVIASPEHVEVRATIPSVYVQPFSGVPPALLSSGETQYKGILEGTSVFKIRSMAIAITITVSGGDVQLAPVPFWFKTIRMLAAGGSRELHEMYDDCLFQHLALVAGDRAEGVLSKCNLNTNYKPRDSLAPGTTTTFYLPLYATVWDMAHIAFQFQKGDLHVDFTTRDCKVSGTGTVTVNYVSLVINSDLPDRGDMEQERNLAKHTSLMTKVADPMRSTFLSKTLQAGQQLKLKLSDITGDVSHLLVLIRDNGAETNTSNARARYKSLGPRGTYDILTPSGQSTIGMGTAIPFEVLQHLILPGSFDNDFVRCTNAHIIPFTKDVKAALHGHQGQGYRHFDHNQASAFLALTPDAAGTPEIQTITCSATLTGKYRLSFGGEFTSPLAHDAITAIIKAAIEGLHSFKSARGEPRRVVVNSTLEASPTTFAIMADEELQDKDMIQIHPLEQTAVGTTVRTTRLKPGWFDTSGGDNAYNITVYAYRFREAHVLKGSIELRDLVHGA